MTKTNIVGVVRSRMTAFEQVCGSFADRERGLALTVGRPDGTRIRLRDATYQDVTYRLGNNPHEDRCVEMVTRLRLEKEDSLEVRTPVGILLSNIEIYVPNKKKFASLNESRLSDIDAAMQFVDNFLLYNAMCAAAEKGGPTPKDISNIGLAFAMTKRIPIPAMHERKPAMKDVFPIAIGQADVIVKEFQAFLDAGYSMPSPPVIEKGCFGIFLSC
ncbi:hypothetical protein HZC34_06790 [Candidatus Saganbacteria bacterium]|nr:hypothetical protein [Candidatus Saganbacteria bacterium]